VFPILQDSRTNFKITCSPEEQSTLIEAVAGLLPWTADAEFYTFERRSELSPILHQQSDSNQESLLEMSILGHQVYKHSAFCKDRKIIISTDSFNINNGVWCSMCSLSSLQVHLRSREESDRPSLCLHVSARLLLDWFLWNFIMETFMKISLERPNMVKSSTVHGD
jgi:hypothetical protein